MADLIVKVTEKCNSNCAYCDVVRKPRGGETMSFAILETLFRRINEFLLAQPAEEVTFIWHGGEPLLLGPAFLEQAAALERTHCPSTAFRIKHCIQTNLTCLTQEHIPALRALRITSMGTSYDPLPNVRGPGTTPDSEWYRERFFKGLSLLKRNGFAWGIIYVVTRLSLARPLDLFYYLVNLCPGGNFNLNPVLIYDNERKHLAITPREFADFLGALFPVWWKHQGRYPNVQPLRRITDNIRDNIFNLGCCDSGECAYSHVNIAPNGETSQCGRSADWELLPYGNIQQRSLAEILADSQRDELARRNAVLRDGECAGCRFWELCHGGCPLDAWSQHKGFLHKSEWCDSKRMFITDYFEPITGLRFQHHGS
ncbi:MAG TPA: radical SAM protein [Chitinivibrionales bacterium]|jgi:radical SAM protein with 4Fe4S-binding SPASM domain|nr:radical SAM protein [Chitinivibrionales bacterium]